MLPIILYENILRNGTLTTSGTSADDDYHVNYLIDYKSYSKWKANSLSDPWIQISLSGADTPNCIGIYNHNFDEVGGTIKLQYNDGDWQDLQTITPNGKYPILISFTGVSSSLFRILFTTPTVIPEVAIIFLGEKIEFPYPPISPTSPVTESISVASEISEGGHLLGGIISHFPISINQSWQNITRTWFDANFRPFWFNHARYLLKFFYAFDLTNRPNDVYFVNVDPAQKFSELLTILSLTDEINLLMKGISSDPNYSPLQES